ncbi:hypothetical protein ASZ90_018118 [hydrocarbon metagenome]|uniref:Uncharacterized protein n=1 Tax=hydrocarbon metagenome TaxID=938273 RepID=A0A0W8E757_9ZZZZ
MPVSIIATTEPSPRVECHIFRAAMRDTPGGAHPFSFWNKLS